MKHIKVAYLRPEHAEDGFFQDEVNLGQKSHLICNHPDCRTMSLEEFCFSFNAEPFDPISDKGYIFFFDAEKQVTIPF